MEIIKKIITKGGNQAVVFNNEKTVLKNKDTGQFSLYNNVSNGSPSEFSTDDFLDFYKNYEEYLRNKLQEELRIKNELEDKRIKELIEEIKDCETPQELADRFNITMVETASHWSDLYEGRSSFAFKISGRDEAEIVQLAVEYFNADGDFGTLENRAGEHHHTFGRGGENLQDFQENVKRNHFGDNYFWKDQESEAQWILEKVKEAEDMDEVEKLVEAYNEIETGYYDCNGNLVITNEALDDADFSGYEEDVHSYNFGYRLEQKYSWKEMREDEDE